jgi:predicted RNA binding protein YcfA (HicA-like mRNA interferase family)
LNLINGEWTAGKPSDDLAPGTLNSILKQARLKDNR